MHAYVVWMDHQEAKFYELAPEGVRMDHMKKKEVFHHTGNDKEKKHNSDKFFHEIAKYLDTRASEILLLGPGTAKDQFYHHLSEHRHDVLARRIVAVQSVDHPSDGEIIKTASKFFVHYDQFA